MSSTHELTPEQHSHLEALCLAGQPQQADELAHALGSPDWLKAWTLSCLPDYPADNKLRQLDQIYGGGRSYYAVYQRHRRSWKWRYGTNNVWMIHMIPLPTHAVVLALIEDGAPITVEDWLAQRR